MLLLVDMVGLKCEERKKNEKSKECLLFTNVRDEKFVVGCLHWQNKLDIISWHCQQNP
jgi:hypothetical protein